MDIFSNIGRSLSGSVDKAILCVKKPVKAKNGGKSSVVGSASNIDLQAQLAALNGADVFSFAFRTYFHSAVSANTDFLFWKVFAADIAFNFRLKFLRKKIPLRR